MSNPSIESLPTVCIAANTSWYVYNFRRRLIEVLISDGYRVQVFAPLDEYSARLERIGVEFQSLRFDNRGTNPVHELRALCGILGALRRLSPDVLLTFTPKVNIYCALAARLLQIPTLANVSGVGRAFTAGGWLPRIARGLFRLALRHPQIVFFQNDDDRREFEAAGLVDRARARRLPGSGVDVDRFIRAASTRTDDRIVFLLVARLLREKGVGEFVEAARMLRLRFPNAEFRLLGRVDADNPLGVSPAEIEAWEREGIVRYLGVTDDVISQYRAADCVVLPSYYREGVPRSLLEAAAMSLPIVTTDWIGCRVAVDNGVSGLLCRPRDVAALAAALERMIELPASARQAMGEAGRQKMVREFDERIVLNCYRDTIASIVRGTAARHAAPTRQVVQSD